MNYISRMEAKSHMFISIDAEALDRIQHHFMTNSLKKLGIEGNHVNIRSYMKSIQLISYSAMKHCRVFLQDQEKGI